MFVAFEGIDGSGKTALVHEVAAILRLRGFTVLTTSEPTPQCSPARDLLAFCIDRAQHLARDVDPAHQRGEIVLCDRYYMSTVVYQAQGTEAQGALLERMLEAFTMPDVWVLCLAGPATAVERCAQRGEVEDLNDLTRKQVAYRMHFKTTLADQSDVFAVHTTGRATLEENAAHIAEMIAGDPGK